MLSFYISKFYLAGPVWKSLGGVALRFLVLADAKKISEQDRDCHFTDGRNIYRCSLFDFGREVLLGRQSQIRDI